ncbi:MAG TPA: sporulation integral membrane protein YtvI [Virgibacillus sp.]|nr:sporulation integral membrane protein YtvI [Virgibacillus sp.]
MTKNQALIFVRLVAVILAFIAVVWGFTLIFSISYPFWIAALLVWMFYPLVRLLIHKLHLPNGIAVFIVLLISLAVLAGAITGIIFLIVFAIKRISEFIPEWIQSTAANMQGFVNETILPLWQKIGQAMDIFPPEQQSTLHDGIVSLGNRLAESFTEYGHGLAEGLTQVVFIIPTFIIAFVFIFVAFYFIGKDWDRIMRRSREMMPSGFLKKIKMFKHILRYRVFGFVRAQFILMFIASLIVFIGISILRVDHSLTIAIIVGIAEILPYFGTGTILIPWFIYMFFTGNIGMGIGLGIVYAITFAVRQSIEPKILSTNMNINALAALISLFVGMKLFGVMGVFIGPLLLVVLVVMVEVGFVKEVTDFILYGFKDETKNKSHE